MKPFLKTPEIHSRIGILFGRFRFCRIVQDRTEMYSLKA